MRPARRTGQDAPRLRRTEERLSVVDALAAPAVGGQYDALPDAVVATDGELHVVEINRAACRLLRRSDHLVGRPVSEVMPLRDDRGRDWWDCLDPVGGLRSRVRQPEKQLTLAGPDGSERDVMVTMAFQRDGDRRLSGLTICLRDMSARARSELGAAELVSTVAHELRSPLTSVKGFTATLLARWDRFDDEQRKLMLQTVNADADRVTRLITELLDVSRIESGRLEVHKQVIDVERIVRRDIAARMASGEDETKFEVTVGGELPEVWADPDKIAQVVGNLVENALRHGAGTVRVMITPDADGLAVTVTDSGEGIGPEAATRVFRKFWRGTTRGGTGLGLYIAKGIVDAHGGVITAGRGPDGGAVVRFSLPAGTPDFAV